MLIEAGWKAHAKRRPHSLRQLIAEDEVVAKRGKPSLPRLKFMEGPGPEDPKFEPSGSKHAEDSRAA